MQLIQNLKKRPPKTSARKMVLSYKNTIACRRRIVLVSEKHERTSLQDVSIHVFFASSFKNPLARKVLSIGTCFTG